MLGLIFTSLNELIEQRFGLKMWNDIIRAAEIPDNGAFTLGASYPDEQMVRLVTVISEKLSLPIPDVLRLFGEHVFDSLTHAYPDIIDHFSAPKNMLMHVDDYIHREIAFYHPQQAGLPTFSCTDTGPNTLSMRYSSPRKLCFLAEGIIQGVARYFNCNIALSHDQCVHRGDDFCLLNLVISDVSPAAGQPLVEGH